MFFEDVLFPVSDIKLFDSKNGLKYGNMFSNEYVGYKNYKESDIIPTTKKGELLLKIYEYDFALNDLSLFLDLHPDDQSTYELFRKYTNEEKMLVDVYEKNYGPLELCDSDYDSYMWYMGPWTWTKEGSNV